MLELMQSVRLAERYVERPTEPALRRPQAARRDRPRVRRRPAARRLRRADLGARRLGAGRDPQPARRAAGQGARLVHLHLARPRRRALRLRPDRRALPRAADGARQLGGRLLRPAPPLHRGAALGRADDRRPRAASGSSSRARSRAPRTRPPAVCSTPAVRAASEPSATRSSRRSSRSSPNHLMRCHIPIDELRVLQAEGAGERLELREDPRRRAGSHGWASSPAGARPCPAGAGRSARAPRGQRRLPLRLQRDRRHDRVAVPGRARATRAPASSRRSAPV